MISRPGLLLLLISLVCLCGPAASATSEILSVEITIREGAQPVRFAPVDADAFQRRLNSPPPYVGPKPAGESFVVTSAYWDVVLRAEETAPRIDANAAYFQEGGIIRARQGDRDVYLVLDLRQRALLSRYIRLARTGSLPSPTPGALDVLIAAARADLISIELAGKPLSTDGARVLWRSLDEQDARVTFHDPPRPPERDDGYWLTFTTSEGRSLQYFYESDTNTLTDFLGTESYTIRNILPTTAGEPLQIEQQEPHGSKLWWPVMLGGGAALLGAAVWARRRWP